MLHLKPFDPQACDVTVACQVAKPIQIVSWRRLLREFDGRVVGLARLGHRQIRGQRASLRMLPQLRGCYSEGCDVWNQRMFTFRDYFCGTP